MYCCTLGVACRCHATPPVFRFFDNRKEELSFLSTGSTMEFTKVIQAYNSFSSRLALPFRDSANSGSSSQKVRYFLKYLNAVKWFVISYNTYPKTLRSQGKTIKPK